MINGKPLSRNGFAVVASNFMLKFTLARDTRVKQPYEALRYFTGCPEGFAAHSASFSHPDGSNVVSMESFDSKCVICTNMRDFVLVI